jgi:hypothetical protein
MPPMPLVETRGMEVDLGGGLKPGGAFILFVVWNEPIPPPWIVGMPPYA